MIYIDTNVLVAYINPRDELHHRAISLLSKHDSSELVVSQIVVLELYSVFSRTMNLSDVEIEALVNYTIRKCGARIIHVEWDELFSKALSYANALKLRTLDLLHVTAAHLIGASAIITFDKDVWNKHKTIKDLTGIEVTH